MILPAKISRKGLKLTRENIQREVEMKKDEMKNMRNYPFRC
jgi:hypothetical protein